jgi:hypothetical protein
MSGSESVANSGGLAASLVASANPSRLYSITGFNNKASDQYIQVHDAASLPADAAVPKLVLVAYARAAFAPRASWSATPPPWPPRPSAARTASSTANTAASSEASGRLSLNSPTLNL